MSKPQGNQPLRYPTIYDIPISKEEMGIITTTGLIKGIDENGFVLFYNEELSGSHVYWSNLKEIRKADDQNGLILIYKNLSDEILPSTFSNWDELIRNIPEEFGDFSSVVQGDLPTDDFSELTGMDYEEAKDMVSEISQMRDAILGDDTEENSDHEEVFENVAEYEDIEETPIEIVEEEFIHEEEEDRSQEDLEEESRYEVAEYETSPKMSDEDLLKKILAEATGSSYGSENLRYQRKEDELTTNVTFKGNASIEQMSSLGFEVKANGESHSIDFGKFSDAYFSEDGRAVIFEHRNGKTLTFPKEVQGWKTMIQKMPFRFRSFDRKRMLVLATE